LFGFFVARVVKWGAIGRLIDGGGTDERGFVALHVVDFRLGAQRGRARF